jgi:hypothetical protein
VGLEIDATGNYAAFVSVKKLDVSTGSETLLFLVGIAIPFNFTLHNNLRWNRESSVGIAVTYGLDSWGLTPGRDKTASTPALGPIQPRILWVPRALFLGLKRPGPETDHSPP